MAATSKKAKKKTSKKATAGKKTAKKAVRAKTAKKTAKKSGASRAAPSGKKAGKKTTTKAVGKKVSRKAPAAGKRQTGSRKSGAGVETHSVVPGISPYKPGKTEEYMNEAQREHFRELLLAWRSQLVSDIARTINSMQDESINHPDPTDRATQETDMSLELRSRDRERKLIKKIDETIQRIDEDDYGFCDNCGVEIGIARLEARPTATLCIDCKTLDEIRERQMV
jgi:DnaK suppressor protein